METATRILIVTSADGAPLVLRNEGGNANHALRLALKGLNDNRSGVGTKVEVQAGASWQKWETVAASGFLGQSAPEVLAGLGAATDGRRGPVAVAKRRRAGRSRARGREAADHRADRSPRQLVPDRVHVERHRVRVHHGRHRTWRGRALGGAGRAQRARSGRVHQDCRRTAAVRKTAGCPSSSPSRWKR